MNGNQKQTSAEQMTPKQILAEGWHLTRAILALKGSEVPDTIHFQIDGQSHGGPRSDDPFVLIYSRPGGLWRVRGRSTMLAPTEIGP
jgi:hypothetical protein